ncbi:hypothetical protein GF406_13880 [candidate division KSB1 bacterium]|nr:hypothetical protein [candidate division KSB1 bacterium]
MQGRHCFRLFFLLTHLIFLTRLLQAATLEVSTFAELTAAVAAANRGDEIVMADGVYQITGTWAVAIYTNDLTIRSQSGIRENVILRGFGMFANGHHGFYIDADSVTIQDLTVENVRNHCIQTAPNTDDLLVQNCILRDAGEQILKVPYNSSLPDPSERGRVQDCLFYYTAGAGPRDYIGGIDVHLGSDWVIRNNTFRDIVTPTSSVAEHAIHFWSWSENTLSENNLIINCDRGIGYGLTSTAGHHGGIIRNNIIYHDSNLDNGSADVAIEIVYSDNTQIYNNTVYQAHDNYYAAIKAFGDVTTNAYIANNLLNMNPDYYGNINSIIWWGGGATGSESNNVKNTLQPDWFASVNPEDSRDTFLHLNGGNATVQSTVIDQALDIAGFDSDFDGETRTVGQSDIGADDYQIVYLDGSLFLQGPYGDGSMTTALTTSGFLSGQASPYDGTAAPASVPANTVDWIYLQLRSGVDGETVTGRSVYLSSDGHITDLAGNMPVALNAPQGSYYLVVTHRNHLEVMSSSALSFTLGNTTTYAFDAGSKFYAQQGYADLGNGIFGAMCGDMNQDGMITTLDYVQAFNGAVAGANGYLNPAGDLDFDGVIDGNDWLLWVTGARTGATSAVP